MQSSRALVHISDLVHRIGITLTVVAVYFAGRHVPLPGLAPEILQRVVATTPFANMSIFALNIIPLVSVLVLLQMAKIAFPQLARWQHADPRNATNLRSMAIAIALLFAAVQGLGFAVALEQVPQLVPEPGIVFRLNCAATLVAATALIVALIEIIDNYGLGSGLWILLVAIPLALLPTRMSQMANAYTTGQLAGTSIVLGAAFTVLIVAAVSSLMLAWGRSAGTASAIIWPPLIAYMVMPWLFMAFGLALNAGDVTKAQTIFSDPGPWFAIAATVLVGMLAYLYVRMLRESGIDTPINPPVLALVLAAIGLGSELMGMHAFGATPLSGAQVAIATAVAVGVLQAWNLIGAEMSAASED